MVFTADFEFPTDEELTVQELDVSTSVLRAASNHLGKACEFESLVIFLIISDLYIFDPINRRKHKLYSIL